MHVYNRTMWMFLLGVFVISITPVFGAAPGNEKCMNCHGRKEIIRPGGEKMYIDPVKFAATTHAIVGCTSCHERVSTGHPGDGYAPSKATCGDCHGPVFAEYSKSLHGSKAGCTGCHNPHEVRLPMFVSGEDINQ